MGFISMDEAAPAGDAAAAADDDDDDTADAAPGTAEYFNNRAL